MTLMHAVFAILGLIASVVTIQGGRRLQTLSARNTVMAGAVLGAVQPILWTFSGCLTSSCGVCVSPLWFAVSILGVVAAVMVFTAINDPDVASHFEGPAPV